MVGVNVTDTTDTAAKAASAMVAKAAPAPVTRIFGWLILAFMAALLINNYLTFFIGLPGTGSLFGWQSNGDPNAWMWLQVAIYVLIPGAAVLKVLRTPKLS